MKVFFATCVCPITESCTQTLKYLLKSCNKIQVCNTESSLVVKHVKFIKFGHIKQVTNLTKRIVCIVISE